MSGSFKETTTGAATEPGTLVKLAAISVVIAILAIWVGLMSDVVTWGWELGRSIF